MKNKLIIIGEIFALLVILVLVRVILGAVIPIHREVIRFVLFLGALLSGLVLVKINITKK